MSTSSSCHFFVFKPAVHRNGIARGIRQVSPICTRVCSGGRRQKDVREERQRFCSCSVQHLSPSWGCCDYLVEIATLSAQTKLTVANDPWTGIDSCRKCRQCSLHPEWIRYLHCICPLYPILETHTCTRKRTRTHQRHMLPMWFI